MVHPYYLLQLQPFIQTALIIGLVTLLLNLMTTLQSLHHCQICLQGLGLLFICKHLGDSHSQLDCITSLCIPAANSILAWETGKGHQSLNSKGSIAHPV